MPFIPHFDSSRAGNNVKSMIKVLTSQGEPELQNDLFHHPYIYLP